MAAWLLEREREREVYSRVLITGQVVEPAKVYAPFEFTTLYTNAAPKQVLVSVLQKSLGRDSVTDLAQGLNELASSLNMRSVFASYMVQLIGTLVISNREALASQPLQVVQTCSMCSNFSVTRHVSLAAVSLQSGQPLDPTKFFQKLHKKHAPTKRFLYGLPSAEQVGDHPEGFFLVIRDARQRTGKSQESRLTASICC